MSLGIGLFNSITGTGKASAQLPEQQDIVARYQDSVSVDDKQWIDTKGSGDYEVEEAESIDIVPGKTIEFSAIGAGFSLTVNSGTSTCSFTGTTLSCTVGGSLFDFALSDGSTTWTYSGGEGSDGTTLYANEVGGPTGALVGFTLPTDRVQSIEFGHEWSNYSVIGDGSKIAEDQTDPGLDVLGNPLTNPGTPQKNMKVNGYTGTWDGATYGLLDETISPTGDFKILFKFNVTDLTVNRALIGGAVINDGIVRLASTTGRVDVWLGGAVLQFSSVTASVDTETLLEIERVGLDVTATLTDASGELSQTITSDGINTLLFTVVAARASGLSDLWEGSLEHLKIEQLGILTNHLVVESDPTSLQDTIYDIVGSNHATLTGATLPFFTTEMEGSKLFADGFTEGLPDGVELWDDNLATGQTGWSFADGRWRHVAGTGSLLFLPNVLAIGSQYKFNFIIEELAGGSIRPRAGTTYGQTFDADGTYEDTITCADDGIIRFDCVAAFDAYVTVLSVQKLPAGLIPAKASGLSALDQPLTNQPAEFIDEYALFYAPLSVSFYDMSVIAGIDTDLYLAGAAIGLTADAWILLANNPLFFGAVQNMLVAYDAVQSGDTLGQINNYLGI